jgi:gas vesicle structural protein
MALRELDFMTVASQLRNRYLDRPSPSSLADVIDTILDKGLVIDIYVRVSQILEGI